jgi:hypothetical protein
MGLLMYEPRERSLAWSCRCDTCGASQPARFPSRGEAMTKAAREGWSVTGSRITCKACYRMGLDR